MKDDQTDTIKIEIFDIDRTIIAGSTGRLFASRAIKWGIFPWYSLLYIPLYFIRYYFGKMNGVFFRRCFPLLKDQRREEMEAVSRECFEVMMKQRIYPEALNTIRTAQHEGRTVLLATSSIDVIVKPLADFLHVDFLATRMEFRDEKSTGYFIQPPVFAEDKKNHVAAYLSKHKRTFVECIFYSDSINDLPLLEVVGHPVAVNPDIRLRRIAEKRGWAIRYFKKRRNS